MIYIPEKICVGYQNRSGTYTGKLAYVIYYDDKGKLRKETSWNGWRDDSIPSDDFDNTPTEGFVLNKKVGDYRYSYYDSRKAWCRVYDPRGFEFEISVENLLFILEECNSIKGKGLEGEFVYAWDGADLILLPVCSADYKDFVKTKNEKRMAEFVTGSKCVVGYTYENLSNNHMKMMYLGRYDYYEREDYRTKATIIHPVFRYHSIVHIFNLDNYSLDNRRPYKNKGKHYYFWEYNEDGSHKYFKCYKSLPSKSIILYDSNINIEMLDEKMDELKRMDYYSPVNDDELIFEDMSFESFSEFIEKDKKENEDRIRRWGEKSKDVSLLRKFISKNYIIDDNDVDALSEVLIYDVKGVRYRAVYPSSMYCYDRYNYYQCPSDEHINDERTYKECETIEELYDLIHPQWVIEKLQNGEIYRKAYVL